VDQTVVGWLGVRPIQTFERDLDRAYIATLRGHLVTIAFTAVAAGLLASWLLARKVLGPVGDLTAGTRRLTSGDYEARISSHTTDEIGELARDFLENSCGALAPSPVIPSEAMVIASDANIAGSPPLVLVVEDEPKLASVIMDYLSKGGFATAHLEDGLSVVPFVRERRPDVVILDLMLPGRGGLDVCKDLRAQSRVPILMVTALVEEIDRLLGLELGADDYI
jgi:CheY-like chemotaxis protein/HAMP domain-containing protein